jgi:hypothetical protein
MRSFLNREMAQPAPQASSDFLTRELYGRKKGGRVQDYEDRSHDAVGKQYRKVSKANGGMAEHEEDDHEDHEDEAMDRALVKKMVKPNSLTGKSHGGRTKRASGGKAGKSTVNVIIGGMPEGGRPQQGPGMDPMLLAALAGAAGGPGAPPPPPPGPQGNMPPPPPPQMAAPPMPMPPQGGPGGPGPMMRARGGRTFSDIKVSKPKVKDGYPALTGGSGGGKGRREKVLAYGEEQD